MGLSLIGPPGADEALLDMSEALMLVLQQQQEQEGAQQS